MRFVLSAVILTVVAACSSEVGAPTSQPAASSTTSSQPPTTSTGATTSPSTTGTTTPRLTSTTSASATSTTGPATDLQGEVIVLDPGHNGMNWAHPEEINRQVDIGTGTKPCNTTGTSTSGGYSEADFTWEVALLARTRLEQLDATVILTREDNRGWGPCITERAAIGNRAEAGAVISIHADGGPHDGRGFHVIYPKEVDGLTDDIAADSLRLARLLHASYSSIGMPVADYVGEDGYSERDDLGGLTLSDVPVVFLEAGNMRHPVDANLLTDPTFQDRMAEAITRALVAFLNE